DFLLVLILITTMATYHDFRSVLAGLLSGALLAVFLYSWLVRFPFIYPANFSYNAIAGMYLFSLFVSLLANSLRRSYLLLAIGLCLWGLVVATTSIKANLGIGLGVLAAAVIYLRYCTSLLIRNSLLLGAVLIALGGVVTTNQPLVESLYGGFDRIQLGL